MDKQEKITKFYKKNRRMPSLSEIADLFGYKSRNTAVKFVRSLEKRGIVQRDERGYLIPKKIFGGVRVLGTVEAGWPSPAEEETADTISIDEWLETGKESIYSLHVKGDSMIDAGIFEGDLVLIQRGREPKNGDIVVARLNDGWTMKYFQKKGKTITLLPGNKKYKPIIPNEEDELEIAAVVTAQIRKYH